MKQLLPEKIAQTIIQGRKALQLGAIDQAEIFFSKIVKARPDVLEAHASLAYIYSKKNIHLNAIIHLKVLLKANPEDAQAHYNLANCFLELKQYAEAINYYEIALIHAPKMIDARINCGICYRMLKNFDLAIQYLHQALDVDKSNVRAFHVLGMIYVDIEDINRALHCLESAVGLAPKHAEYRVSFANVLEKAYLDFEAGLEYHKACEIDPFYLDSFIQYGDYLFKGHRYDEALECMRRADVLSPINPDILDKLGKIYLGMSDTDSAIEQFQAALKIDVNRISSLLGLGQVYKELGNSAKGIEVCNKIVAINPNKPDGYLLKSGIRKSKSDDGLSAQLIQFTKNVKVDDEALHCVHFALGKIFDDQNKFSEAFDHYALGNDLKNKTLNYRAEEDEKRTNQLIDTFNAKLFSNFKHLGVESSLPIIIVGMPRSGTTLTEQIISSHPKVMGAGEEIFWSKARTALPLRLNSDSEFPNCVSEMSTEQAKEIANLYESTLRNVTGAVSDIKHITDKMPHNFTQLGLIALLFPNVKIIHTIRNPIDTCLSIYFQNFNSSHRYAFDLKNLGFHYKQYQRLMNHWHDVLPGRILDVKYEDTIADPELWSRRLINYVGLEWDEACLAPHKLERNVKTASHWQVRQPIYKTSVERWKNYAEFLEPLITALK